MEATDMKNITVPTAADPCIHNNINRVHLVPILRARIQNFDNKKKKITAMNVYSFLHQFEW